MTFTADEVPVQPVKPIRFAASYDGPSLSKKRRINAACGTCRRRKTRCDGTRPVCLACKENGNSCLGYETPERSKNDFVDGDSGQLIDSNNGRDEAEPTRRFEGLASIEKAGSKTSPNGQPSSTTSPNFGQTILDDSDAESMPQRSGRTIPYFRYFGPTAIVPGFKQMVVNVKEHKGSIGATSAVPITSPRNIRSSDATLEPHTGTSIPLYDPDDLAPLHPLIKHLVETFFTHLGCNFPFLRRDTFLRRLEEKTVETILVDAICALAARFSTHPLLAIPKSSEIGDLDELRHPKSDYGIVFAHRARSAVVDSFPCPTVVSVQACLLLAYEGFGTNQDSALWMYLGCAIRMAQDLGLQKQEGIHHLVLQELDQITLQNEALDSPVHRDPQDILDDHKALEQSYLNTYWAVLMLDRVISSGTGRPVTLRDQDMDVPFPPYAFDASTEWPVPFPALIRVIHIYGRVSDLLNNIRRSDDLNPDTVNRLDEMEQDLTNLYQKLDPRLNFHVVNFQHYAKAGQGTNFILLHFWFHTLIIILHQPTLLHSFEGSIHQLFPNSRELSMSSAKTIADILAFAELTDARSFVNNPFTSQPMYIAASAFLMEIRQQSSSLPTSQAASPGARLEKPDYGTNKVSRKHGLLVSAAKDNYQRCYKSLQQLERYWAGTKYILTALDQKAKGIWDMSLETYTLEEMEYARRQNAFNSGTSPASGSQLSKPSHKSQQVDGHVRVEKRKELPTEDKSAPKTFPTMSDIGNRQVWTLNGNTNSRNANLTFLYQNPNGEPSARMPSKEPPTPNTADFPPGTPQVQQHYQPGSGLTPNNFTTSSFSAVSPSASLLNFNEWALSSHSNLPAAISEQAYDSSAHFPSHTNFNYDFFQFGNSLGMGEGMTIESQDIDIPLEGDTMSWLEYLPRGAIGGTDAGAADASRSGNVGGAV